MIRRHIKPGTRLPVQLSVRERDLVVDRALLDPDIETQLRQAPSAGSKLVVNLNLDDIDDLVGCVAAEANHCDDAKVQKVLDAVCDRLAGVLDHFTDQPPPERPVPPTRKAPFTTTQGRYLAFIHYYTKLHRVPPAEGDLQRYFRVSPPTVHAMIVTLERRGFIERTPGKARSIRLTIGAGQVPDLT